MLFRPILKQKVSMLFVNTKDMVLEPIYMRIQEYRNAVHTQTPSNKETDRKSTRLNSSH